MSFSLHRAALFVLLALCACGTVSEGDDTPPIDRPGQALPDGAAACRADEFQSLLGQTHSDLLRVEILAPVRIIRPNEAVTMDFIANRLNIALDENEVVTRVFCG